MNNIYNPGGGGRWFFALRSSELQKSPELLTMMARLKKGFMKRDWQARFVRPELLHITVHFLGDLKQEAPAKLIEVVDALCQNRELSSLDLELRGLSGFPDIQAGRVVYVGVSYTRELAGLQAKLHAGLAQKGLAGENDREYRPHLSIARLRSSHHLGDAISPWVRRNFGRYRFDHVDLLVSRSFGPETRYDLARTFQLQSRSEV